MKAPRAADDRLTVGRSGIAPWVAVGLLQLAGGAALAIGILGVARGGRDLWLAIAVIVLATLFGLRSVALDEKRREHERRRWLDDVRETIAQVGGLERTVSVMPTGRIRRWLRYLAG
jgi:hypothetical protein